MLSASKMSSRKLGSGTSMTKIRPTAAMGMIHSEAALSLTLDIGPDGGATVAAAGAFAGMA